MTMTSSTSPTASQSPSLSPSNDRHATLLRLITPLDPGRAVDRDIVLERVETDPSARLVLREGGATEFSVRFQRSKPGAGYYATTGRVDLILDVSSRPSRAVETFVRGLCDRVRTNVEALGDDELDALLVAARAPGIRNPYMRRHVEIGMRNLIDINVGDGCNLLCTFCTDVNNRGRDVFRPTSFWKDQLAQAREQGKAGVLISGNEPTLRSDIPEIAAEAKRLGYREIELSTAGVRLANKAYLAELIDAGVNVFAFSVHGSNAEIDGLCTGRPDFFEPRRRGFENFLELVGNREAQAQRGVYLKTISIFTKQNLDDIRAMVDFLFKHEVAYVLLYYPWIKGDALTRFDEIAPDYPSVVRAIETLSRELQDPECRVSVSNLPPCVAPGLTGGRTRTKDIVRLPSKVSSQSKNESPLLRVQQPMDPSLTHTEVCAECDLRDRCGGVALKYRERFGSLGLRAVTAADSQ